jgi:Tol biopolymer transport system component
MDETLNYCLDDGASLVYGSSDNQTRDTLVFPVSTFPAEAAARDLEGIRAGSGSHDDASAARTVRARISRKWFIGAAALAVVIVSAAFGIYKFLDRRGTATSEPFGRMKISKLTAHGNATSAVISPDGKQVVYVVDEGGRRSLWLRQVVTASEVQLSTPEDIDYRALNISPDGNFLYYAYGPAPGPNQSKALYQMPLLGGTPRKLVDVVSTPIAFSPDGSQIAFVRNQAELASLIIARADGTDERTIATRQSPGSTFGNFGQGGLAWSPDGSKIAAIAVNIDSEGLFLNVIDIPVAGGPEHVLTPQRWGQIERLAWVADGGGLIMTAAEQATDTPSQQIWYLNYATGEARKITNDLNYYESISLNADSSILVSVQKERSSSIWVAENGDAARAIQLTSTASKLEGALGVAWTPDGRIVYRSAVDQSEGIWIMDDDGKNRSKLTTDQNPGSYPAVSADGRFIYFVSAGQARRNIWRMNIDGSDPRRLTDFYGNVPKPMPDGRWVIFQTKGSIWKMPIDGGEPARLTSERALGPAVSPDGRLVACALQAPNTKPALVTFPPENGEPIKAYDAQLSLPAIIRWAPDSSAITYVSRVGSFEDIWTQPIAGGSPKRLTNFKTDQIFDFDWSRDGKLVIAHGSVTSDLVLIRSIR